MIQTSWKAKQERNMSYEIVMPRLGWNMEEGTLVEWLKEDGEMVSQGETVCTIEGDKAATDIESFESGILKIPDASPPPGKTVPVGTLLGYVVSEQEVETFDPNAGRADDTGGESGAAGTGENVVGGQGEGVAVGPAEGNAPDHEATAGPGQDRSPADVPVLGAGAGSQREQDVPAISPRARRAAQSAGIDWRALKGSGRSGRVVERDVLEAARKHGHGPAVDGVDGE